MDKLQWKLKPIHTGTSKITKGKNYYSQILVYDRNNFPLALIHIDSFHFEANNNNIYNHLDKGKEIIVSLEFVSG